MNIQKSLWECIREAKENRKIRDLKEQQHREGPRHVLTKTLKERNLSPVNVRTGTETPLATHSRLLGSSSSDGVASGLPQGSETPIQAAPRALQNQSESTFYSKWRLNEVEKHVLRLLSRVQRKANRPPDAPYEFFPLQQSAFTWADNHELASELRVFSFEKPGKGTRSFIVTTYEGFWERYHIAMPSLRHFYEIIRSGTPCHLYLDLEYNVTWNPDTSGDALVDLVLHLVAQGLKEKFDVEYDPAWVIELDSSTPAKFSRHIILRIPDHAFANNTHVGIFIQSILPAAGGQDDIGSFSNLWVKKDGSGNLTCFVDGGVYTRNRSFRLFLSSKAGKEAVLRPTGRFASGGWAAKTMFFNSLICNVPARVTLLRMYDDSQDMHQDAVPGMPRRSIPGHPHGTHMGSSGQAHPSPSPYPQVDAFITSTCTEGGVRGAVRSWLLSKEIGILILNMRDNRYCGNVGRHHKSNGIFYVVDLQGGTWFQKCYDPDCRSYRSPAMPLPPEVFRSLALHSRPEPLTEPQVPIHAHLIAESGSPMQAPNSPSLGPPSNHYHATPLFKNTGVPGQDSSWCTEQPRQIDRMEGTSGHNSCEAPVLKAGVYTWENDDCSADAELLQVVEDMELDYACLTALEQCSEDPGA